MWLCIILSAWVCTCISTLKRENFREQYSHCSWLLIMCLACEQIFSFLNPVLFVLNELYHWNDVKNHNGANHLVSSSHLKIIILIVSEILMFWFYSWLDSNCKPFYTTTESCGMLLFCSRDLYTDTLSYVFGYQREIIFYSIIWCVLMWFSMRKDNRMQWQINQLAWWFYKLHGFKK